MTLQFDTVADQVQGQHEPVDQILNEGAARNVQRATDAEAPEVNPLAERAAEDPAPVMTREARLRIALNKQFWLADKYEIGTDNNNKPILVPRLDYTQFVIEDAPKVLVAANRDPKRCSEFVSNFREHAEFVAIMSPGGNVGSPLYYARNQLAFWLARALSISWDQRCWAERNARCQQPKDLGSDDRFTAKVDKRLAAADTAGRWLLAARAVEDLAVQRGEPVTQTTEHMLPTLLKQQLERDGRQATTQIVTASTTPTQSEALTAAARAEIELATTW